MSIPAPLAGTATPCFLLVSPSLQLEMPAQPHSPSGRSMGMTQVALAGLTFTRACRRVKFGVQVPACTNRDRQHIPGLPSTQSQPGAVLVWGLRTSPGTAAGSVLYSLLPLPEERAGMALAGNSHHHCPRVPPQPLPAGWQRHLCSEIEAPAPGSPLNSSHCCTVTISKQRI